MLTVPIHKDVSEYKPKIIGGLTTRTLLCLSAAALSAAGFGCICTFVLKIDINSVMNLVWFAAAPAAAIGFYRPHGMDFEKFVPLWWAHTYGKQLILYESGMHRGELAKIEREEKAARAEVIKESRNPHYERLRKKPGLELWTPGGQLPGVGRPVSPAASFWDSQLDESTED